MTHFPTKRPIRLLLINPALPESFWSFRWWIDMLPGKRAINLPLGLATLAGLCPSHWHVSIVDENVQSLPLEPEADLVGVCGMGAQFERQREILRYYRNRGYPTVAGGSFASLCPEDYADLVDFVVAGEAEYIWPAFCQNFEAGIPRVLYREVGQVDLRDSPVPRYDLLDLDAYTTVSMQFSRGCPYRCEFCDIIVMFGRRPRTKTPEQIGRELDLLRARSVRSVFFVDDNLIGNKKEAKRLLRYLADYQRQHNYQFSFSTQVSLNLADDAELLQLFRVANFAYVFIGIESSDEVSLKETGKTQNLRRDMLTAVRTIYSHGIDVLAGFIVGFDNDTLQTFERQYRFITDSGIQVAMVGLLTALPHTPLYVRLQQEGRLLPRELQGDNTKPATNVLPKRMEYDDMVCQYETLFRRLFRPAAIAQRILCKTRHLHRPVPMAQFSRREQASIIRRLLLRGILPGGPVRLYRFVRTLAAASPAVVPQVITDWIAGLAMRDYVRRHFGADPIRAERLVNKTADWLRQRYATSLRDGMLWVSAVFEQGRAELELILCGQMGRIFSDRTVRHLERMLRCSATTLSLRIEELRADQRDQVQMLLRRLEPYGQRVSIWVHEGFRHLLPVDSSTFHLVLEEPTGCR
jgi:radical SAM superfamily enzyme YgiQ (UPF0313 family)